MLKTVICDLFGIKYPIIQGGMAYLGTAELVSAVSNAGGLGIIGAGNSEPDWVREQIRLTRQLTDKPFGVNIMLLSPFTEQVVDVVLEEKVAVVTTGAGNPGCRRFETCTAYTQSHSPLPTFSSGSTFGSRVSRRSDERKITC